MPGAATYVEATTAQQITPRDAMGHPTTPPQVSATARQHASSAKGTATQRETPPAPPERRTRHPPTTQPTQEPHPPTIPNGVRKYPLCKYATPQRGNPFTPQHKLQGGHHHGPGTLVQQNRHVTLGHRLLRTPTAIGHPSWPFSLSVCVSIILVVFLFTVQGGWTASRYDTKA